MNFKHKVIIGFFVIVASLHNVCMASSQKVTESCGQKTYYKEGCALLALGILGNLVGYVNSMNEVTPGSFLNSVKTVCSYPVPEFSCDPGVGRFANQCCTDFFKKSLIFTLGGVLPGIFLLWYSYRSRQDQESKDANVSK